MGEKGKRNYFGESHESRRLGRAMQYSDSMIIYYNHIFDETGIAGRIYSRKLAMPFERNDRDVVFAF